MADAVHSDQGDQSAKIVLVGRNRKTIEPKHDLTYIFLTTTAMRESENGIFSKVADARKIAWASSQKASSKLLTARH